MSKETNKTRAEDVVQAIYVMDDCRGHRTYLDIVPIIEEALVQAEGRTIQKVINDLNNAMHYPAPDDNLHAVSDVIDKWQEMYKDTI